MKYDDASWHYGGDFPPGSPHRYGAVHIGVFLRWCFQNGFVGDLHKESDRSLAVVSDLVVGRISGTDFLLRECDEKFTDEDLDETGNAFAAIYYGNDGRYFYDYADAVGEKTYKTDETDEIFEVVSALLNERFRAFQDRRIDELRRAEGTS